MKVRQLSLAFLFAGVFLAGCAQKPVMPAAQSLAQASSQRGAQAFARGDLLTAQREYATALHIHESLGDTPGRASALLSLARIAAQSGRTADAVAAVDQVLADGPQLDLPTRITAQGRAAALQLSQGSTQKADEHLAQAGVLCAGTCADAGALAVLRARSALAQQRPADALKLVSDALVLPALAAVTPPTLQPQAGAERANALRLQAQAYGALAQPQAAANAATAALELDRGLGLADRVLIDLQLLARMHKAQGQDAQAAQYQLLADRAAAAGKALRGELRGELPAP